MVTRWTLLRENENEGATGFGLNLSRQAVAAVECAKHSPITATLLIVAGTIVFMLVAAWEYSPWWERAFRSDDSPVSWLSSALLVATATLAGKLTSDRVFKPKTGTILTLAMLVLALDEQFQLHERFKFGLAPHWGGERWPWIGDVPTLLVGVGGLLFLVRFWFQIRRQSARVLMFAAVAIGCFALWVDLAAPPSILTVLEEGFEVLAEALFLSALWCVPPATLTGPQRE